MLKELYFIKIQISETLLLFGVFSSYNYQTWVDAMISFVPLRITLLYSMRKYETYFLVDYIMNGCNTHQQTHFFLWIFLPFCNAVSVTLGKTTVGSSTTTAPKKIHNRKNQWLLPKNKVNPQLGKLSHLVKSLYFNYVSPTVISLK